MAVLLSSWRRGTAKQYSSYQLRWESFCKSHSINMFNCDVEKGIEFLALLFKSGLGYSSINSARSALSQIITLKDGVSFGQHPLVCRFMKGIFELRPSLPKYSHIWDVSVVLDYIRNYHPLSELNLKQLTLNTVMLACLLSGQRCQSISCLRIDHMQVLEDRIVFVFSDLLKHSRPGKHQEPLVFLRYQDPRVCVVHHLETYLDRTKTLRQHHNVLFISYQKPFKPVCCDTIRRWVKAGLKDAGIDVQLFAAHSTRSASASCAKESGLSLMSLMKAAGWSTARTFANFYQKPIHSENFGVSVLEQSSCH